MEYIPIFCPHCGQHINEVDDEDSPEAGRVNLGSLYRCGWCGLETRDWNHVLRCRRTWRERAVLAARQAAVEQAQTWSRMHSRLLGVLDDLEEESG